MAEITIARVTADIGTDDYKVDVRAGHHTFVSDEPFYGAYLKTTGDPQPMADEVMASMDCDWIGVARTMAGPCPTGAPIWYQKHMAHHMVGPSCRETPSGHFPTRE